MDGPSNCLSPDNLTKNVFEFGIDSIRQTVFKMFGNVLRQLNRDYLDTESDEEQTVNLFN